MATLIATSEKAAIAEEASPCSGFDPQACPGMLTIVGPTSRGLDGPATERRQETV